MPRKVKAVLYKPDTGFGHRVYIEEDEQGSLLPSIYKLLECDTIDSAYIKDGISAYVDDEGLLKQDYKYGLVYLDPDNNFKGGLAGNILFVNHNERGDTVDLTRSQIKSLDAMPMVEVQTASDKGVNRALALRLHESTVS